MEKKLDTMRVLGLKTSSKKPQLFASSDASFKIATVMSKYSMTKFIHLHLTSDKSGRAISAALIAKIIDFLENEKNISVIITSLHNVTEAQICLEALALAKSRPVSMIGSLDYDGLIALSKKSSMFIGVYSEVLHISASQNLPTIGLFGPDSAFLVGSWDGGCYESEYAEKNGKQNMGIHTVLQSKLECVPCEQNGCDNSGQSKCLEEDTFEMIKSEIESKLPK
jgi:heptosyltransferase-3